MGALKPVLNNTRIITRFSWRKMKYISIEQILKNNEWVDL
jgi:hypothetical protein